jgi:hypothetical protein
VDGNGAVDLASPAKETAERELNLGRIVIGFRHAREDLGGVIEAVVDEVVEANVVITWQTYSARGAHAAPEKPRGDADGHEGQGQKKWGELKHSYGH